MAYKALDIAKKLIRKAQDDEPNGGERLTNLKLQKPQMKLLSLPIV